jgi:SpoVK/Ycf46/Vps4 family AAA+-type ATPase
MYGLKIKYIKSVLLLLAVLIGLSLTWENVPRGLFVIIVVSAVTLLAATALARDAWKQGRQYDLGPSRPPRPPRVAARRQRSVGASSAAKRRARPRRIEEPDPDETFTLAEEREAADIDEVFTSLNDHLVGLLPVKRKVDEIASLLLVDRVRQQFGLQAPRPNLHMCFTGDPGTGKTTVALQMADLLHRLGYLEKGHLVHAMRDDLIGEFIGHTAPKTKRILERAMGGVLFIDEA